MTHSEQVATLADALVAGQAGLLADTFHAQGMRAPILVWSPGLFDVQHPVLRSLLRACGGQTPVPLSFVDTDDFAALADWTMVVEMTSDDGDGIYRHYGAGIAESYGRDLDGQRIRDIGGHVAVFFEALYLAASRRNEIVKTIHEPPRQVFVNEWRRLVVPLTGPGDRVRRFAVANVPDNPLRAGLDILPDPVLVVAPDGRVMCANRAACLWFGRARCVPGQDKVSDWTGADVTLPGHPDEIVLSGAPRRLSLRVVRGGKISETAATVGATYYRDMPFFVIHFGRADRVSG